MNGLAAVFALAALPALGNIAGGLIAEVRRPSDRNLNRALHAAAGIVLAIVAVELMPRALAATSGWLVGAAFGVGGLAYIATQAGVERLQARRGGADRTGMWMIYIAVAVDLFPDGLMIGAGATVATGLGLLLALGQVLADVPEGFATLATLESRNISRRNRLLLSAALIAPPLLAAGGAYLLLRGQAPAMQMAALVFTAGLLTVAAVEDMIAEAHESAEDRPGSVAALVGGFVLFTFVSAGLGG